MTEQSDKNLTLPQVRERIDAIDKQLQALLSDRAQAALDVARIKRAGTPDEVVKFYRPEREAQILRTVAERNEGPLKDETVQRIFREIISASLALEQPLDIAYLGPEGTYSHAATLKHFGHAVNCVAESGISEIFHAVETQRVNYGLVPVENSTEGAINHTLDLLMDTSLTKLTKLTICGEVSMRIQHCLLSANSNMADIKAVHAHPQALAQCRGWLDQHLPDAMRVSESSNAAAAQLAKQDDSIAAVAGAEAATRYGLNTLQAGIEDEKTNTTRFYILGTDAVPASGKDSTSLLVAAPHKPGGLRSLLQPFEEAGVSMTRIESRPGRGALWEYLFFIDVSGHRDDSTLAPVLAKLERQVPLMRVLGSYPTAL